MLKEFWPPSLGDQELAARCSNVGLGLIVAIVLTEASFLLHMGAAITLDLSAAT
jgi:hypothetical protein